MRHITGFGAELKGLWRDAVQLSAGSPGFKRSTAEMRFLSWREKEPVTVVGGLFWAGLILGWNDLRFLIKARICRKDVYHRPCAGVPPGSTGHR